jgi:omega-amidase
VRRNGCPTGVTNAGYKKITMSALTVTIVQTHLHWEDKTTNLQLLEEKIKSVKGTTQLVVLPEMFSTAFSMRPAAMAEPMSGTTIGWMKRVAATNKLILTGSVIIEEEGNYFNRLVWMLPSGQYGVYDKRHLFAFAGEDAHYTAGTKRLIASVNGWKINLQVCYDLRFPVWARQTPADEPEYDLLVYVANWPERRNHAWKTLLQARAIENQCYVVGVNRVGNDGNAIYHSGDSCIIDPMGEIVFQQAHEEVVHTLTLQKESLTTLRSKLPFLKDADDFLIHL